MIVLFAMMAQSPSAEESSKIQKNAESECMSESENVMPIEKSLENLEKKLQLT
jgi:hypothetical protein